MGYKARKMNSEEEEEEEAGDSLTDPIRQQAITSESSCHVWSESVCMCVVVMELHVHC